MRLIFLGTGTSFGVPQVGCSCAVCRSSDPRDRRSRCGAVVEIDGPERTLRLLIDTPTELRLQLVAAGVSSVDAVLYTHEHADHVHGIDDVRVITSRLNGPLAVYGSSGTIATVTHRFPYIFDDLEHPSRDITKPRGRAVEIRAGVPFNVQGVSVLPFAVPHGETPVMAYRIGDIGYVTDAHTLPEAALEALHGVRVLVLNALLRRPHPTHLSIDEAIAAARQVGATQTFFTHLTHHQSHKELEAELPDGIAPAYDGLVVNVPERRSIQS